MYVRLAFRMSESSLQVSMTQPMVPGSKMVHLQSCLHACILSEVYFTVASAQRSDTNVWATDTLRKLYPGHSVISTTPYVSNVLALPSAIIQPINPDEMVVSAFFAPLARRSSVPGILVDYVRFGSFRVAWEVKYILTIT